MLAAWYLTPELFLWLLPIGVPMIGAPALLRLTSLPSRRRLMRVPADAATPRVVQLCDIVLARWGARPRPTSIQSVTTVPNVGVKV